MRCVAALAALLFLGGVAASCALWAGIEPGGAVAVVLGGASLAVGIVVITSQLGRWGVPGDEPPIRWRPRDRG